MKLYRNGGLGWGWWVRVGNDGLGNGGLGRGTG